MISGYAVREHIHRNPSNPLKLIVPHKNLEILRFTQDDTIGCSPHKSLEILRFAQDDTQCFGMALREGDDSPTIFPLTSCTFGK